MTGKRLVNKRRRRIGREWKKKVLEIDLFNIPTWPAVSTHLPFADIFEQGVSDGKVVGTSIFVKKVVFRWAMLPGINPLEPGTFLTHQTRWAMFKNRSEFQLAAGAVPWLNLSGQPLSNQPFNGTNSSWWEGGTKIVFDRTLNLSPRIIQQNFAGGGMAVNHNDIRFRYGKFVWRPNETWDYHDPAPPLLTTVKYNDYAFCITSDGSGTNLCQFALTMVITYCDNG